MPNEPTPYRDTVHKFTLVRPVVKYAEASLATRFVILEDSLNSAQLRALQVPGSGVVYFYKTNQIEKVRRGMTWLAGRGKWIATLAELSARYPDPDPVFSRFAYGKTAPSAKDVRKAIEASLASFDPQYDSLDRYLDQAGDAHFERKVMLWDNMLVRYLNVSETPEVREECLRLIRFMWIAERLQRKELEDEDVVDALGATVVLPEVTQAPAAPAPVSPPPATTKGTNTEKQQRESASRLKALQAAVSEITRQHTIQLRTTASAAMTSIKQAPPVGVLDRTQVKALSKPTQQLLRQLRVPISSVHVPSTVGMIQAQIKSLQTNARPAAQLILYNAGSGNILTSYGTGAGSSGSPTADPFAPGIGADPQLGRGFKIGMAPLYVVETRLLKYQKGEVAHIENLLAGETKKRNLRVLNRVEETVATDNETTVVTEKDSQTTDKFELSQEIVRNEKEDLKFDTGIKVTADLGSVKLAASADFSYANAKDSTDKKASTQARETINKAVNSITSRTRTQRSVTTISESEETNEHDLENKSATTNIAGIYRWLDKYLLAELKSYGARKMLEFSIPEPAALYLFASRSKKADDPLVVERPVMPMVYAPDDPPGTTDDLNYRPLQTYQDIRLPEEDPSNIYMDRIKQNYGYALPPAPKEHLVSIQTIQSQAPAGGGANQTTSYTGSTPIVIPADYYCHALSVTGSYDPSAQEPTTMLYVAIGDLAISLSDVATNVGTYPIYTWKGEDWVGAISVAYHLHVTEFVIEFAFQCYLTSEAKDKWRKEAFDAIRTEYNTKLKAYNQWLKDMADAASMSVAITGNNTGRNRQIEQEELKKSCIEVMTGQRFESFDAMRYPPQVSQDPPYYGYPDFSFGDATDEGRFIQFFEEVFDWHLMTYEFFPYFWANKGRWSMLRNLEDTDPIFRSFLQAGAARVQVPVRRNYEGMVDYFIQSSGQLWNGGEAPSPGDALWLSVADDQKNNEDDSEGEVIDQWIIKMPTELVFLDDFGSQPPDNTAQLKREMFQKVKDELGIP